MKSLQNTLDFIREQDARHRDDKVLLLHRPKQADAPAARPPLAPPAEERDARGLTRRLEHGDRRRLGFIGLPSCELAVRVVPRASKAGVAGMRDGALLVRLARRRSTAPPTPSSIDTLARALDFPGAAPRPSPAGRTLADQARPRGTGCRADARARDSCSTLTSSDPADFLIDNADLVADLRRPRAAARAPRRAMIAALPRASVAGFDGPDRLRRAPRTSAATRSR